MWNLATSTNCQTVKLFIKKYLVPHMISLQPSRYHVLWCHLLRNTFKTRNISRIAPPGDSHLGWSQRLTHPECHRKRVGIMIIKLDLLRRPTNYAWKFGWGILNISCKKLPTFGVVAEVNPCGVPQEASWNHDSQTWSAQEAYKLCLKVWLRYLEYFL